MHLINKIMFTILKYSLIQSRVFCVMKAPRNPDDSLLPNLIFLKIRSLEFQLNYYICSLSIETLGLEKALWNFFIFSTFWTGCSVNCGSQFTLSVQFTKQQGFSLGLLSAFFCCSKSNFCIVL